jgi:hypothetical protein
MRLKEQKKKGQPDRPEAEAIALQALSFLATDEQRLGNFLRLTGISPEELRAQAGSNGMAAAILEYLLSDESLLLVFAAESGVAPEVIAPAHALLTGASGHGHNT